MNENLNLVEILKDCPKGTKLYSTIYGEVKLCSVIEKCKYPIIFTKTTGYTNKVTADGRHLVDYNGECTLFPSKDQRDWSKFTAPWLEKQVDSLRVNDRAWLYLVSDVLTWKDGIGQYLDNPRVQELAKRLCSEYAQKLYNSSVIEDKKPKNKVTEPSYRPFKDKDECWNEMLEHHPFGWLYHKVCNCYAPIRVSIEDDINFENFFNLYTFADGTPFGILEK